jgi:hypothetical protein
MNISEELTCRYTHQYPSVQVYLWVFVTRKYTCNPQVFEYPSAQVYLQVSVTRRYTCGYP